LPLAADGAQEFTPRAGFFQAKSACTANARYSTSAAPSASAGTADEQAESDEGHTGLPAGR